MSTNAHIWPTVVATPRTDSTAILIDSSALSQPLRVNEPQDCSTESADHLYGGSQYVCRYQPQSPRAGFTPNLVLSVNGTNLKIYGHPSSNLSMRYRAGGSHGDVFEAPLLNLDLAPEHQTSVLLASLELQAYTVLYSPLSLELELSSGFAIDYVTYRPFAPTQFIHLGGNDMIIDDSDKELLYSDGWTEIANLNAYSASLSMATRINASVSFTFWGSSLTIMGATLSQAPGNLTVRCQVDDMTLPLFEYNNTSSTGTTPSPSSIELQLHKTLFDTDLQPRQHFATITLIERTGSQVFFLDSMVFKTIPASFSRVTPLSDVSRPGSSSTDFQGTKGLAIFLPLAVGCLLLFILGCLWRKRRTRRRSQAAKDNSNSEDISLSAYSPSGTSQGVSEPEDRRLTVVQQEVNAEPEVRHLTGVQQVDAGPVDAPPPYNEANYIR